MYIYAIDTRKVANHIRVLSVPFKNINVRNFVSYNLRTLKLFNAISRL